MIVVVRRDSPESSASFLTATGEWTADITQARLFDSWFEATVIKRRTRADGIISTEWLEIEEMAV